MDGGALITHAAGGSLYGKVDVGIVMMWWQHWNYENFLEVWSSVIGVLRPLLRDFPKLFIGSCCPTRQLQ
jgi:hypothetical protein